MRVRFAEAFCRNKNREQRKLLGVQESGGSVTVFVNWEVSYFKNLIKKKMCIKYLSLPLKYPAKSKDCFKVFKIP